MDRMLYIAMSGAKETMLAQASTTNNLANSTTTGFLADFQQARSMPVFGPGNPTRVYAMTERPGSDFTPGPISFTGRDLDMAVSGEGWFAVQSPDGNEAYTRRGDLVIDANGLLKTGDGLQVIGEGGPIAIPPASKVSFAADGTISIIPEGADPTEIAVIDRIKMVNPGSENLTKGTDGLMHLKSGVGDIAPADADQRLISGALENSNVNTVSEMTNMIELQRRFELQVKMMKTAEEMAASSATILRTGG